MNQMSKNKRECREAAYLETSSTLSPLFVVCWGETVKEFIGSLSVRNAGRHAIAIGNQTKIKDSKESVPRIQLEAGERKLL